MTSSQVGGRSHGVRIQGYLTGPPNQLLEWDSHDQKFCHMLTMRQKKCAKETLFEITLGVGLKRERHVLHHFTEYSFE